MSSTPMTDEAKTAAQEIDKTHVRHTLAACHGNVAATADILGVPRRTLDRRINALGLRDWLTTTYPPGERPAR